MAKLPSMQFYPADWRKDPNVQALGYFERGVWFEILCLMFESEQRGKLILNGRPMPDEALARLLGLDKQRMASTLTVFLEYGVASRDENGALMNRRMVRDEEVRQVRAECGKMGGNPALLNQNATKPEKEVNQISTPSSSSSSSSSDKENNKNNKGRKLLPFDLSEDMREWAARTVPNVKLTVEHARFNAYYTTGKGRNTRSEDWETGLQLWLLNAENRAIPKIDRYSPCALCDQRRRIVGIQGSNPCPDCRPDEYKAWLRGRDV